MKKETTKQNVKVKKEDGKIYKSLLIGAFR